MAFCQCGNATIGRQTSDMQTIGILPIGKQTIGRQTRDRHTIGILPMGNQAIDRQTSDRQRGQQPPREN